MKLRLKYHREPARRSITPPPPDPAAAGGRPCVLHRVLAEHRAGQTENGARALAEIGGEQGGGSPGFQLAHSQPALNLVHKHNAFGGLKPEVRRCQAPTKPERRA